MNPAFRPESGLPGGSTEPQTHPIVERLSHELRTPLNSVIGFSRVLQCNRRGNQHPADLLMLDAIRVSGERLLGLVEDLVALSVAPPTVELPVPPLVNLVEIVEDAVNKWAGPAAEKGITLVVEAESNDPIRIDPMNLARLLDKLIGNAVKFTARGGVVVRVIRPDNHSRTACVIVEDSGIGIGADRLETIFQPFTQVDGSTSRRFEGAGLGLPIARALARSMGCSLNVQSEPGEGTRFEIGFPT